MGDPAAQPRERLMIDRVALRTAAVAALKFAATDAGDAVFSPLDWPTTPGSYPQIIVRTPRELKETAALRVLPPSFFSTITLVATGRVEALTELGAEIPLEAFSEQIENALLTNAQFIRSNEIQQFSSVSTAMEVRSAGETHIGEVTVAFEIEVPQIYQPTIDAAGVPVGQLLEEVEGTVTAGVGGETLATFDVQVPQ
jgi:hypothetical protein